ncbi:MAG: alpha/beta hydrolase fold domain-containing protein, partial [Rhodospirillales bacterium]|nr:alpha/beta hydrolase fold domain-containing protein [Rhodospirillales bacterium]
PFGHRLREDFLAGGTGEEPGQCLRRLRIPGGLEHTYARNRDQRPRIALAGESAGGGLAVATLVRLRDEGTPLPACVWCSSPWVDLENTGTTMTTKAAVDPLISKPYLNELASLYLQGASPRAPLASPMRADLRGLPPMLIQVGSAETLLDDALRLAGVAAAADVRVSLQVWPEMIHAWHLF